LELSNPRICRNWLHKDLHVKTYIEGSNAITGALNKLVTTRFEAVMKGSSQFWSAKAISKPVAYLASG
jgi:hypothetical protein